jgi:signal transduction protein with GAF and PtsI domain
MGSQDPGLAASHVAVLQRVSSMVSSSRSLDEMLKELVRMAVEVTGSDACLVYLLDAENDEVVLRASQLPHAAEVGSLSLRVGEGITGWVAEHRAVVSLPSNASRDSRFKQFHMLVEDTCEALLSVPLVSGGEVIGVLNTHHKASHEHTPEEIALVSFIGEQMGGAIARTRLEDRNARLQEEALLMRRQLETRKLVERAKGILQNTLRLSEEQAYLRMRNDSRRQRRPMRELAEEIIRQEAASRSGGV